MPVLSFVNFEADIFANVKQYTAALEDIKDALNAGLRPAADEVRKQLGIAADGTVAQVMRWTYGQLHMDDLSEKAMVVSHWESCIGELMNPHTRDSMKTRLGMWGNQLHKLQDGFAHSSWAELTSNDNPDMDLRSAKGLFDVYGKHFGRWDPGKLPGLYTGAYEMSDPPKYQKTHAQLNKDDATRNYFGVAYVSALNTTREVGQALVERLKEEGPDLYEQLKRPLTEEERRALQSKYELYKRLAQNVGHWSNGPAPEIPAAR